MRRIDTQHVIRDFIVIITISIICRYFIFYGSIGTMNNTDTDMPPYLSLQEAAKRVAPYRTMVALKKAVYDGRIKSLDNKRKEAKRRDVIMVDTESPLFREWCAKASNLRYEAASADEAKERVGELSEDLDEREQTIASLAKSNRELQYEVEYLRKDNDRLMGDSHALVNLRIQYEELRQAYDALCTALGTSDPMTVKRLRRPDVTTVSHAGKTR